MAHELTHPDTDASTPTDTWLARWRDYLDCQRYHHSAWLESSRLGRAPLMLLEAWHELAEIRWERVKGGTLILTR